MHLGRELLDIVIVHFEFQYFVALFADILESLDDFLLDIERGETEVLKCFCEVAWLQHLFLLVFIDILFGPWLLALQLHHAKVLMVHKPIVFLLNSF